MKKLISLFAALLVAVGTLAVSSCATSHDEDPIVDLSSFYLRGNMNNWANDSLDDGKMTANADGSYSIVYTAKAADDEFAIANSGWSVKYCNGTKVAPDGTDVSLESGGGNAKVTGQTPGNNYKMTVKPSSTSVSVKVELAGSNVPDFYILDTTTGMNKMDYDGTEYSYTFTASGTSESLVVWSKDKYYKGTVAYAKENPTAATLTANDNVSTIDVNGLTKNLPVKLILTVKDSTVSAKAQIAIPDHFKVVMTFKNCTTEKVSFNSNISWGGVKAGKWSVDETVFDNDGKEANLVDGKLTFYVSKDYDVSGTWVAEQAPTGANFKFEATVGSGSADGGLWYKLPLDQDTVEITYYDDQIK